MASSVPPMDLIGEEWAAWRDFCNELKAMIEAGDAPTDLNHERWNPTMRAVELWGERLTTLRIEQYDLEDPQKALADKERAYEAVRTASPEDRSVDGPLEDG